MHTTLKSLILFLLIGSFFFFHFLIGFFAIIPFWFLCGLIDVSRHKTKNFKLLKEYFFGKGKLTFILSPLNLLIDLISHKNLHTFNIDSFPQSHKDEIEKIIELFDANTKGIEERFSRIDENRTMLFYKWFGKNMDDSVPDFNIEFKNIKTIGVSLFREKTSTSRHFGPLRVTYRLLYNFNKVKQTGSYIEADGTTNIWKNNPLFIFDDTLIHQSFNEEDSVRYCAFIDIIRPNYANKLLLFLMSLIGLILKNTRAIFYKNWKII